MRRRNPTRRAVAAGIVLLFPAHALAQTTTADRQRMFMDRAFAMKAQAEAAGDQGFGAVLVKNDVIIGESPSRVVTDKDPTAHVEMSAIRAAGKAGHSLSGAVLYSTFRPCSMCRAAANWVGVARMIYGRDLIDGGAP